MVARTARTLAAELARPPDREKRERDFAVADAPEPPQGLTVDTTEIVDGV